MKRRISLDNPQIPLNSARVDLNVLEQLFDLANDVTFFVKDVDGRYLVVNDSLVERHGFKSKSQVVGKQSKEICPGDLGRIPTEQDSIVIKTGKPLQNHLELHWYGPYQPGWCLTTKLPIRDELGRITGLIGISRDVRTPTHTRDIPPAFARAIEVFERDVSAQVSPALLAEQSQLSPQRLAKLTKQLFGLTPGHYITKTRLTIAADLLRTTNQSISEIAISCGFCDHSAFTRAFRNAMGVTPTDFRLR